MADNLTRGFRNHNPMNIRKTNDAWQGLKVFSKDKEFCEFSCDFYGFRAAFRILSNYFKRDVNTVSKIINTWAPSFENPTLHYINFVCNSVGVGCDDILDINDRGIMCQFALAMSYYESKHFYPIAVIENAYDAVFNG